MPDHPVVAVYGFSLVLDLLPLMGIHKQVMRHGRNTVRAQATEGLIGMISKIVLILLDGTAI
jgi:hypothetical protein